MSDDKPIPRGSYLDSLITEAFERGRQKERTFGELTRVLAAEYERGRVAGLEEAANACDTLASNWADTIDEHDHAWHCAETIRAIIRPTPTDAQLQTIPIPRPPSITVTRAEAEQLLGHALPAPPDAEKPSCTAARTGKLSLGDCLDPRCPVHGKLTCTCKRIVRAGMQPGTDYATTVRDPKCPVHAKPAKCATCGGVRAVAVADDDHPWQVCPDCKPVTP
jgi:hypothetical protein